jgi:transcriptional regulator GlxA family with amidase domain
MPAESNNAGERVGFILLPGFALTSFSLAVETFSVANTLSATALYEYALYAGTDDGDSPVVVSSNDVPVQTRAHFTQADHLDTIVVCAHRGAATWSDPRLFKFLRAQQAGGARIVAVSSAALVLARAGVLEGRSCTLIEEDIPTFAELYPEIRVRETLYTASGRVLTSAGGMAALDMLLYTIVSDQGEEFARSVSQRFLQDRIRSPDEAQNARRRVELRMRSPVFGEAVEVMEDNIEQPPSIAEIARKVGTTTRALELAFRGHAGTTPARYFVQLRLDQARRLLADTNLPVGAIAQATGFSSQSHFTRRFRGRYGATPRAFRGEQKRENSSLA